MKATLLLIGSAKKKEIARNINSNYCITFGASIDIGDKRSLVKPLTRS